MTDEARRRSAGGPAASLAMGVTLLLVAGFVDAVGVLAFGLFPSFRSGDTTLLGLALAERREGLALLLGGMVAVFVAGAFLGRLLRLHTGRRWPALALETLLLAAATAGARFNLDAGALALAVLAMGVQSAVVTQAGGATLGATYVTGALSRLGMGLADALAGVDRRGWAAHLVMWLALASGAAGGALCYGRVGRESLLFATGVCAALGAATALVERRRPGA